MGGSLRLHGHGLRGRIVRGPRIVTGLSKTRTIKARRYVCLGCDAVLLVVPREVERRRSYLRTAVGLALCLFGLLGRSASAVRETVGVVPQTPSSARGAWATLGRWIRALKRGELLPALKCHAQAATPRESAAAVSAALSAVTVLAPAAAIEARVFDGAARFR